MTTNDSLPIPSLGIVTLRTMIEPHCLQQILPTLRKSKIKFFENDSSQTATQSIQELSGGLILLCVADKTELVPTLTFLSNHATQLRSGKFRAIVLCQMDHPKVPALLKSKGATDVCLYTLSSKALSHKIQQSFQMIQKKLDQTKTTQPVSIRELKKSTSTLSSADSENIRWHEHLEIQSDCWLFDSGRGVKNILGRWLLEVMGPSPGSGSWQKHQDVWKWIVRDPTQKHFSDIAEGDWYFSGRIPEFIWKTNRWRFAGDQPALYFIDQKGIKHFRVQPDAPGKIGLAKNSPQAEAKRESIQKTFDIEYLDEASRSQKAKALTLDLTPDAPRPDWNQNLTPDDPTADWGQQLADEENAQDWNQHDLGEEDDWDEWGGIDLKKENIFNNGRGLGQGTKSEKSKENDWKTGSDAFESLKLRVTCLDAEQTPLQILEYTDRILLLDAGTQSFMLKQPFIFRVFASYGVMVQFDFQIQAEVIEVNEVGTEGKSNVRIQALEGEGIKLEKLYGALRKRQEQIMQFLREARGF